MKAMNWKISASKGAPLAIQTQCNNESITLIVVGGARLTVSNDYGNSLSLAYTDCTKRSADTRHLKEIKRADLKAILSEVMKKLREFVQGVVELCIATSIGILKISDPKQIRRLNDWLNSPA